nr:MAG TPA: hypothetical protein [Caudoviricetes sp.]
MYKFSSYLSNYCIKVLHVLFPYLIAILQSTNTNL